MKQFSIISVLFACLSAGAQNLVSNPGFEDITICPDSDNQVELCEGWIDVEPTSDYYNCFYYASEIDTLGYSGTGYMGVSCLRPSWNKPYREYVGRWLDSSLVQGQEYYVEIWVKSAGDKCVATDAFGILFTNGLPQPVDSWTPLLPYTPQVQNPQFRMIDNTFGWIKICGTFVAQGGENFMTIGSFKDDDESTFTKIDTSYCSGDSYGVHWSYVLFDNVLVTPDLSYATECDNSTVYVEPDNRVYPNGTEELPNITTNCDYQLANVITPNGDQINDFFPLTISNHWTFRVMNRWGNLVYFTDQDGASKWNGKDDFGNILSDGVYFYLIEDLQNGCSQHGTITIVH